MPALKLANSLAHAESCLKDGPHPERARQDAEFLLCHLLGQNRAWLLTNRDADLNYTQQEVYEQMSSRRLAGEPIQHITGEAEFHGLPFCVNRDVLIPRPETEHLVEKAIELAAGFTRPRIADIGTGSGAIAVALAHEFSEASIAATDISVTALDIAQKNAESNGVEKRIRFRNGDLLAPFAGEKFDIVASNPPYVPESDRDSLAVEVRDYEPARALFAGEDGLAIYRRLIPAASDALVPGGFIVLEIGYGQQASIRNLLAGTGFTQIEFAADLQGIPRVASARRC